MSFYVSKKNETNTHFNVLSWNERYTWLNKDPEWAKEKCAIHIEKVWNWKPHETMKYGIDDLQTHMLRQIDSRF